MHLAAATACVLKFGRNFSAEIFKCLDFNFKAKAPNENMLAYYMLALENKIQLKTKNDN